MLYAQVNGVDGLEVRHVKIHCARDDRPSHDVVELSAFNTDGFDVTGRNVWIHDCEVIIIIIIISLFVFLCLSLSYIYIYIPCVVLSPPDD